MPDTASTPSADRETQLEQVFDKVALHIQARERLCGKISTGEIALRTLLQGSPISKVLAGYKLLMLLDAMPGLGKVPARRLLGDRQAWKVGEFTLAELGRLVSEAEAMAETQD